MNLDFALNQEVTVQAAGPPNRYGEVEYLDPETVKARKEIKQSRRLGEGGAELLTQTKVTMLGELQIGDYIDGEAIQDRENIVAIDGEVVGWIFYL